MHPWFHTKKLRFIECENNASTTSSSISSSVYVLAKSKDELIHSVYNIFRLKWLSKYVRRSLTVEIWNTLYSWHTEMLDACLSKCKVVDKSSREASSFKFRISTKITANVAKKGVTNSRVHFYEINYIAARRARNDLLCFNGRVTRSNLERVSRGNRPRTGSRILLFFSLSFFFPFQDG